MDTESTLLALPPEILDRISSFLTTPELGYLRRTCKHVEATLFENFAKEFFTKRQFMVEQVSLEALVGIANHPTLSQHLAQVIISTHTLAGDANCELGYSKARYAAGHASRDLLLFSGRACEMLVEAFSKLPNLRTIGLRDYDGQGRVRDGEQARWRSYGWRFGLPNGEDMSTYPSNPHGTYLASPDTLFQFLLFALGKAQARPQSIEVFLRGHARLTPQSFDAVGGFLGGTVTQVLTGLTTLMLTIRTTNNHPIPGDNSRYRPLQRFLHYTSRLNNLRLNFESEQQFAQSLLEWLAEPAPTNQEIPALNAADIPSVTLPHLKGLDLGMLNVSHTTLVKVIAKFDPANISLWKVTLRCDHRGDLTTKPNRWSSFFKELADALPASTRMSYLLIGYPSQGHFPEYAGHTVTRVQFGRPGSPGRSDDPMDRIAFKKDFGADVKAALRKMGDNTMLPDHEALSHDTLDDADGEGDEDEEEDDFDEEFDADEIDAMYDESEDEDMSSAGE